MRCLDCGQRGAREGHQTCQYPGLRLARGEHPSSWDRRIGRPRRNPNRWDLAKRRDDHREDR